MFEFEGEILFNPYDCGTCLELTESGVKTALSKMNDKQVIKLTNSKVAKYNFRKLHNTGENFLTESGVYKLIFKSQKKRLKNFKIGLLMKYYHLFVRQVHIVVKI